jgi:hypothetical protein
MVVNTDDGTIVVDVTLGGIKAWQYREEPEDDNEYPVRIYDPGIAWDTERELLYIVHAETDSVTVVNLETGATTTTEYAPRQSLTGKLLDWLVPAAAASPVPHTSRIAVLSPDGQSLFVAGTADHWNKEPGTNWNDGWPEELSWTGLQVLDTSNLSESRTIDLPPISGMTLSPDGSRLILQTFTHGQVDNGQSVRENQQIVALAADDLRQLGAIDIPGEYTIHGFSADGAHLYVSERLFIDEIPSIDLLVIDLDTWTATVARTLDDTWFGELVVPVE